MTRLNWKNTHIALMIIVLILFVLIHITITPIDEPTPNALFYLNCLPFTYWILSVVILLSATKLIKGGDGRGKILWFMCVLIAIICVEWFPNILMKNPWYVESYGRLARSQLLSKEGHRDLMGEEAESPAFLLYGSIFLLLTSLNPFIFAKLHELIVIMSITLFLILLGKELGINHSLYTLIPIAFFSVMWLNEFHFSRQSLLITAYPIYLYLLCKVLKDKSPYSGLLYTLTIPWLIMSHPATIPVGLLSTATLFLVILTYYKFQLLTTLREIKRMAVYIILSLMPWLFWHTLLFQERSSIPTTLYKIVLTVYKSLLLEKEDVVNKELSRMSFTEIYRLMVYVRNTISLIVIFLTILMTLFLFLNVAKNRNWQKISYNIFVVSLGISNLATTGIFLYCGHVLTRGYEFLAISWALELIFILDLIIKKSILPNSQQHSRASFPFLSLVVMILFLMLFSMPILKYAPIPFLYPSTKELSTLSFVDKNSPYNTVYFITEYNTPHYLLVGNVEFVEVEYFLPYYMYQRPITSFSKGLVVDGRIIMRDAFYSYVQDMSYKELLEEVRYTYSKFSNIVYYADTYYVFFYNLC
jgi:hypothetical protein